MNDQMMENLKQATGNPDSTHGEKVMELLAKLNEAGMTIDRVTNSRSCAE
jgi:hypothetical protein